MTPDLLARVATARAARDPRCTDDTGATWRTAEKREFMDALRHWHEMGSPEDMAGDLEARRAALIAADLW